MQGISSSSSRLCALLHRRLAYLLPIALLTLPAFAGSVSITSPASGSTSISAVRITASASVRICRGWAVGKRRCSIVDYRGNTCGSTFRISQSWHNTSSRQVGFEDYGRAEYTST